MYEFDWEDFREDGIVAFELTTEGVTVVGLKHAHTFVDEDYIIKRLQEEYSKRNMVLEEELTFEYWMYFHADKLASYIVQYVKEAVEKNDTGVKYIYILQEERPKNRKPSEYCDYNLCARR
jgi:hypothetical protein